MLQKGMAGVCKASLPGQRTRNVYLDTGSGSQDLPSVLFGILDYSHQEKRIVSNLHVL